MTLREMVRRRLGLAAIGVAGLITIVFLVVRSLLSPSAAVEAGAGTVSPTTPASTTILDGSGATTTTIAPTDSVVGPPAPGARYLVPEGEVEREAKQLATDIAYALTTYEESDDPTARFSSIAGAAGVDLLAEAGVPLTHRGRWSRGQVVYPQLGGLTNERVSVMVVTRQTVGIGAET